MVIGAYQVGWGVGNNIRYKRETERAGKRSRFNRNSGKYHGKTVSSIYADRTIPDRRNKNERYERETERAGDMSRFNQKPRQVPW